MLVYIAITFLISITIFFFSTAGYLSCFQVLLLKKTLLYIFLFVSFGTLRKIFFLGIYLRMELLGHAVYLLMMSNFTNDVNIQCNYLLMMLKFTNDIKIFSKIIVNLYACQQFKSILVA